MPSIEVSYRDLCGLIGKVIPLKVLEEEGILYAKGELENQEGDLLKLDIKDTNRPDLWSAEGIARELRGRYVPEGRDLPSYTVEKPSIRVIVDPKLKNIRPLTVCAVVRNLEIEPDILSQMIQLQEKVSITFGRNRKEVAIGAYDLHKITPPIKFTSVKPEGIKFIPLEFKKPLTPRQILQQHPKGKEYGHLLAGLKEYPIFIDSAGEVLSMPPIINSEHTGKVTERTRDLFIECSGFDMRFLIPALNVLVTALSDRGARIEAVEISLPNRKIITPDLSPKKASLDLDYVRKLSGLKLGSKQILDLLEQARYKPTAKGKKIEVLYPAYRQDIMHPSDIAEDIIISYGYNKIKPEPPKIATLGRAGRLESFSDSLAELMVGLGFQETLSYILSSKETLFQKMGLPESQAVEIENIISANWSVFRTRLLPGLLEFLSKNKHRDYPQRVFEIGDTVLPDPGKETRTRDVRKLACLISDTQAGYEEISSILAGLFSNLGIDYKLKRKTHPSFIPGRCAGIFFRGREIGIIGEVHPGVLSQWNLEKPVTGFEIDLDEVFKIIS